MSDFFPNSDTTEVSGNTRIESLPDRLTVTLPAERSLREFVACGFVLLVVLIIFDSAIFHYLAGAGFISAATAAHIGPWIRPAPSIFSPFVKLFICCLVLGKMAFDALRSLFGGRQIMRCTRSRMEIVDMDLGRVWRRREFARKHLEEIVFGSVGMTIGSRRGLTFVADGNRVRIFPGLKAPEAERILAELKRLGFDTMRDPQMLHMVELERTRRKYVFPTFR
jgi:hypothetical protein